MYAKNTLKPSHLIAEGPNCARLLWVAEVAHAGEHVIGDPAKVIQRL